MRARGGPIRAHWKCTEGLFGFSREPEMHTVHLGGGGVYLPLMERDLYIYIYICVYIYMYVSKTLMLMIFLFKNKAS